VSRKIPLFLKLKMNLCARDGMLMAAAGSMPWAECFRPERRWAVKEGVVLEIFSDYI
jgi:hypothetical protein